MSSLFNALYIQIMKVVYAARDALPPDLVLFARGMRGRIKTRKSAFRTCVANCVPDSIRGFWYRWDWWKAIWLKKFFSEEWLYERDYQRRYKKWEKRLFRRLVEANASLGRPLTGEESEKLKEYEERYTSIRLWFMDSHATIIGLCIGYTFFAEDAKKDDGHVCRVLYRDGEFDSSYSSPNEYLSDKFYEEFDSITKENVAFWYEYLMRNRDKITVETIEWHLKREYEEANCFWETGKEIVHEAGLKFSDEEEYHGREAMKKIDVTEPYVCIFARDVRYNLERRHISTFEQEHQDIRNSDISSFKEMTQQFWLNGIQSVRMGSIVATKYECEGAVDYANSGRTEFLDAFIFSKCRFFIGDASGIVGLAYLFGRPVVGINLPHQLWFDDSTQPMALGIYLRYYDCRKKRFLSLREMTELLINWLKFVRRWDNKDFFSYIRQSYEVVYNTPEEILEVAREMDAIQNGSVQYTKHDEALQRRHREIVKGYQSLYPLFIGALPGRIGMQWLRDNEWFLD